MSQSEVRDVQQATLGGGCFWCLEAVFSRTQGVIKAESGYANGHHPAPTYEEVCTGQTGHAEVVQITFDATQISYPELLDIFFTIHDPTTLNRQGNDVGTQYRSGIYTHDDGQARMASVHLQALREAKAYGGARIVTEMVPLSHFHPAEPEHQRYFKRHPTAGYCAFVVAPKVAKFQQRFPALDKGDD